MGSEIYLQRVERIQWACFEMVVSRALSRASSRRQMVVVPGCGKNSMVKHGAMTLFQ